MGCENEASQGLSYAVRRIYFEDGERLPMLVYTSTGLPVFSAMNYVLGKLRAQGQAANSIEQCCRVLGLLHHWLDHAGIDLLARCMAGKVLEDSEIDELENLFRLESKEFVEEIAMRYAKCAVSKPPKPEATDVSQADGSKAAKQKVVSLEQFRKSAVKKKQRREVSAQTQTIRLLHAQAYLKQMAYDYSARAGTTATKRETIRVEAQRMADKFKSLGPGVFASAEQPAPEGLEASHAQLLLEAIEPAEWNTKNPWIDPFVRKRNQLMILVLLSTGMRGGELLKMKTSDIHRSEAVLSVTRTPGDVEDPRIKQPQAKTRSRDLGLDDGLYAALNDFVGKERRAIPAKQRKHPFMWTTETGEPLSINALSKVFSVLRKKTPALPRSLTAHALRYTATDDLFDRLANSEATEEQAAEQLRYVMGWSPSSNMPARYARRKIRTKANDALLGMQKDLFSKKDGHGK